MNATLHTRLSVAVTQSSFGPSFHLLCKYLNKIFIQSKCQLNVFSFLQTLIAWLERGECSKKNSTLFYSMIQATNSHIRRLFSEKMQAEEELQECKEKVKIHIQKVIEQRESIPHIFIKI